DACGRLDSVTYGDGSGYRFRYDPRGRLLTVRDPADRVLESHTYDPVTGRAKTSSIADTQENLTFDFHPLRTTVKDALGNVTPYDYTEIQQVKRVAKITGPCACGGSTSMLRTWTYDAAGRAVAYKDGDRTTAYRYDNVTSDLLQVTD